jgi:hypothetical protein
MNCCPGNGQKAIIEDAVTCHVKGLMSCYFGAAGMKTLAHVSGGTIGHLGHDDYEWEKILFHPEIKGLGAEMVALNLLVAKFNALFKFKSMAPVPDANGYFHTWFQSTHNYASGWLKVVVGVKRRYVPSMATSLHKTCHLYVWKTSHPSWHIPLLHNHFP